MHGACMRKTYIFLLLTVLILPSLGLSRSVDDTFYFLNHFTRQSFIFVLIVLLKIILKHFAVHSC